MSARLILHLADDPSAPLRWLQLDRAGGPVARGLLEDGEELPAGAAGSPVIIGIAAGTRVLLSRVAVPTQSRQKLAQALPFAMEDQVAEDVETLHFAPGRRDEDGQWHVAVTDRAWLDAWINRLGSLGLQLQRLVPESLCLPREAGCWTALADEYTTVVRTTEQGGFAGDTPNLGVLLEVALDEDGVTPPEAIRLLLANDCPDPLDGVPEGLPVHPETVSDPLAFLARGVDDPAAINLLVGDYSPSAGNRALWRPWIAAGVLLAVWVLIGAADALLEQRQMRAELAALEAEIHELVSDVLPRGTGTRQIRSRLESQLNRLRGDGELRHRDGALDTLTRIGPVLQQEDDIRINGLSWRGNSLELELHSSNLQNLDRLTQALEGTEGISAEVRSASSDDDLVRGRLLVRRSGS